MSDSPEKITDEELDNYLDGQLSAEDAAQFEHRLAADPDAARIVEAQRELDARLSEAFSPPTLSPEQIARLIRAGHVGRSSPSTSPKRTSRRKRLLVALAIATSIAWVAFIWYWGARRGVEPFFEPRPLANVYRETVDQGYRPYYFCEDEERFAMTFAKRQNAPLRLAALPADRHMIGLSYPGGLSRDTTAVLCYVEDQPVIVFVDVLDKDDPTLASSALGPDLYVHRTELGELVIYEVSPLQQTKISDFLQLRD